jgi:S-adenosylmethionine-diacylglycerol 3-amino-3-carboxypropyl transferase
MSPSAKAYFEKHMDMIRAGIIHQGKFENYFRIFRRYVLPLVHGKKQVDALFREKTISGQLKFYDEIWNNKRWRLLFRLFFSEFVLGRLGRDPAFFKEVGQPVAESIFKRAERHLQSMAVFHNHFLDYQMRGSFSVALPLYLRPGIFERVRANIQRLQLFKGYLTGLPAGQTFDMINLSNIFEYMDMDTFRRQAAFLERIASPRTRIAYWNLLVDRQLHTVSEKFEPVPVQGEDLCFFYQGFYIQKPKA